MKAIAVEPHKPQTARLGESVKPQRCDGSVLLEAVARRRKDVKVVRSGLKKAGRRRRHRRAA